MEQRDSRGAEYHQAKKLIDRGVDPGMAKRRASHLIREMRRAFDDAETEGWEALEGTYSLPDPNDEHVVAAAFVAGAGAIVPDNWKDFPESQLPPGIETLLPQEFATNTVAADPVRARAAVVGIANRSGRKGPLMTEAEVLDVLVRRYGMAHAVELLRE